MRGGLKLFAEHMRISTKDSVVNEAESPPQKKQRQEVSSKNQNVEAHVGRSVQKPEQPAQDVTTDSSGDDDIASAVTAARKPAHTSLYETSRKRMRSTFVPVRPEGQIKRKLTYSINPLHCAGVRPHKESTTNGKVHAATIEISLKIKSYGKMLLSPGMLVQIADDDSNLNYIVHHILCYTNRPNR